MDKERKEDVMCLVRVWLIWVKRKDNNLLIFNLNGC